MKDIIDQLQKAYDSLNQLFASQFPRCVLTLQSNKDTKRKDVLGYCTTQKVWVNKNDESKNTYEIALTSEYLNRDYFDIMETLLHEMVHVFNLYSGVTDCSVRGKHNERYKVIAESIGLIVEEAPRIGFAVTSLSDELKTIVDELEIDRFVFNMYRYVPPKEKKTRVIKPIYKYSCPNCGEQIKSNSTGLLIECKNCEAEYDEK